MFGVVIVAAGSSRRMGFDKLKADLLGMPVLERTIRVFSSTPEVSRVVVVTRAENVDWIRAFPSVANSELPIDIAVGGRERQDSVLAGLLRLQESEPNCQWAAVHDGARPLISSQNVRDCFAEAREFGSGCLATPVTDTLKRADASRTVLETIDRTALWAMQTPQIFNLAHLIAAYRRIIEAGENVTDEAAAMEKSGHPVHLVANPEINSKITFEQDLRFAELILRART